MSDDTAVPKSEPSGEPATDAPVGDMTEEGQTELGPYPSLTNVENWEESDLGEAAEGDPAQDE